MHSNIRPITITLETKFNKQQLKELTKPYLVMFYNEIYLITKQVRSCAWIDLPEEIIPYIEQEIIASIQIEKLKYYILPFDLMDNTIKKYIQIIIYKYNWQKQLFIKYINKRNTVAAEFIFGKLFGYSDESINKYLINKSKKDINFTMNNI